MKNKLLLFPLLFFSILMHSQDKSVCKKIVDLTVDAIHSKSSDKINNYLAVDFTIANQTGDIAKLVLDQIIKQLGDTVNSVKELSANNKDGMLELKYEMSYEKMGVKQATFIFNDNNKLQQLDLFKMEVKTMKGDSEVIGNDKNSIVIPFEMAGNLIAIEVELNGEKRKFILDSGSPKVILNSKYFNPGKTTQSISSTQGASGSISGLDIQKVKSLRQLYT